ncbi:MAG: immunoglobulin domain-containing protein [Verrucomicrobiota bacterium]|jgi:hypothetical protein
MKFKMTRRLLAALLAVSATIEIASAAPIIIPDFSFENEAVAPGGATGVPYVGTNWSDSGNTYIQNITNTLFTATLAGDLPATADGTNYAVVNGGAALGELWQDIGPLQPNTTYTLTIAVGESLAAITGEGFIGLANNPAAYLSAAPFYPILASTPVSTTSFTPGTFVDSTLVCTTGYQVSGDLTVLMETTNGAGAQLLFDNVRLSASPATSPTALLPSISVPSTNGSASVYAGYPVTLSENPAGTAPFTYQWLTDNGTSGATYSPILNATNQQYALNSSNFLNGSVYKYEVIVDGSVTSAPVSLSFVIGAPVITQDTLPNGNSSFGTSSDVVGSQVTFTTSFVGNAPLSYQWMVDYGSGPGHPAGPEVSTNATLTVTNLQQSDSGLYFCVATDPTGSTSSTEAAFTVNPVPAPDANGIVISPANQYGLGGQTEFAPTWVLATNSLIAGLLPTSSIGDFQEADCGGLSRLTKGYYGILYPQGNASPDLATAGNPQTTPVTGPGSYITYTLPASPNGWDITNITIYGGWSDGGRDQQNYTIAYSTVAAPTNFSGSLLANAVNYLPSPNDLFNPPDQSATRITLTSGTGGAMVHNIAALQFFFGLQAAGFNENQWEGYAEIDVQGTSSAPAPVWLTNMVPATIVDVVGSQETMFAVASSSVPLHYQWQVNYGSGPGPILGQTNATLTLTNLQQSDDGTYSLIATAGSQSITSLLCSVTVNSDNGPDGFGVIEAAAYQNGNAATFTPTWTIAPGSLIAGTVPTAATPNDNSFTGENSGGLPILTDGRFGSTGAGNNATLATCGNNQGQTITYTLTGSESGYDITNIEVYGGWSDGGRNEQAYTISYSTVTAPTTFTELTAYDYLPNPNPAAPNAERLSYTSGTPGSPLAIHVAAIKFDFTTPNGGGENGYEGYAEIDVYGSNSVAIAVPPNISQNTLPSTGFDVVGSQVTFTAAFNSSAPMSYQWLFSTSAATNQIPGATATTLTLNNLQLTNTGSYTVFASNSLGEVTNTVSSFTVNPAPSPVNNLIVAEAGQTWTGTAFTPTWPVPPGSLIAGNLPTSSTTASSSDNFVNGNGGGDCGGIPVLTDGLIGPVGGGINTAFAAGGNQAGETVTYTLTGAANGYNLSSIVVYGGWQDDGRDEQAYTISYSTVSAPSTFITLEALSHTAALSGNDPNATRLTFTENGGAPLAANVAAVKFDFSTGNGENNWEGYSEICIYGTAVPPSVKPPAVSGGNLILTGAGGTPDGSYTWLTSTNLATPLTEWTTNSTGVFDGSGAFSNAIPIIPSQPGRFFVLRIP